MNLMQGGFLLVLFAIVETISGLTPGKSVVSNNTQDLPAAHIATEKSQQDNGVTDSLKIITQTSTMSSTTPAPTPPPTPAPTPKPSPSPAPSPAPSSGNTTWVVRNSTTQNVCIIAEMSMQLNITYPSNKSSLIDALVNIPKNSTVNGSCSEPIQSMIISWGPNHSLQFNFSANKASKNFYVSGISLSVNSTVFKDAKANTQLWNFENRSSEFTTPLEMSYKCIKVQDVNLKSNDDKLKAVLSLKDTQLQAFMNKTSPDFEAAQNCDTFDTPDIVPIAVGCALAILVLVVLVAYLIGRKRSQNRGYLSM